MSCSYLRQSLSPLIRLFDRDGSLDFLDAFPSPRGNPLPFLLGAPPDGALWMSLRHLKLALDLLQGHAGRLGHEGDGEHGREEDDEEEDEEEAGLADQGL